MMGQNGLNWDLHKERSDSVMRKLMILVLLLVVAPVWAGLGDIGKLKKLVDKKESEQT